MTALLADTLGRQEGVAELSELLFSKTLGNPFFTQQLITSLADDGHLRFDCERGAWRWNMQAVREAALSDNVVTLLADHLGDLPATVRRDLELAACIGNRFDAATLATVAEAEVEGVRERLEQAIGSRFVTERGGDYHFVHDRVQQAAYSLIPVLKDPQRALRHWERARSLSSDPDYQIDQGFVIGAAGGVHLFWVRHLRETLEYFTKAYHLFRDSGDNLRATTVAFGYSKHALYASEPLSEVEQACLRLRRSADARHFNWQSMVINVFLSAAIILARGARGRSATDFVGTPFDDGRDLAVLQKSNDRMVLLRLYTAKFFLATVFGEEDQAARFYGLAESYRDADIGGVRGGSPPVSEGLASGSPAPDGAETGPSLVSEGSASGSLARDGARSGPPPGFAAPAAGSLVPEGTEAPWPGYRHPLPGKQLG